MIKQQKTTMADANQRSKKTSRREGTRRKQLHKRHCSRFEVLLRKRVSGPSEGAVLTSQEHKHHEALERATAHLKEKRLSW